MRYFNHYLFNNTCQLLLKIMWYCYLEWQLWLQTSFMLVWLGATETLGTFEQHLTCPLQKPAGRELGDKMRNLREAKGRDLLKPQKCHRSSVCFDLMASIEWWRRWWTGSHRSGTEFMVPRCDACHLWLQNFRYCGGESPWLGNHGDWVEGPCPISADNISCICHPSVWFRNM